MKLKGKVKRLLKVKKNLHFVTFISFFWVGMLWLHKHYIIVKSRNLRCRKGKLIQKIHQSSAQLCKVLDLIYLSTRLEWGKITSRPEIISLCDFTGSKYGFWLCGTTEVSTNEMERLAEEQGDDSPAGLRKERQTHWWVNERVEWRARDAECVMAHFPRPLCVPSLWPCFMALL